MLYSRLICYVSELGFLGMARGFLKLFLVVFPFQIRTLVFNMSFFPTGNFNEYASYFIYLSDLLLLGAFILFALALLRGEKTKQEEIRFGYLPFTIFLMLFLMTLMGTVFVAEYKMVSFFQVFRFVELFLLYFLLVNELLERKEVIRYFLYGVIIQTFIALGQYLLQSSVGLRFLGEPILKNTIPGVAKIDLDGFQMMRSYGTFPHPNALAGTMIIALLWAYYLFRRNVWIFTVVGGLCIMALLFTFSRSAFLALAGGLLVYFSLFEGKIRLKHVLLWGSVTLFIVVLFNMEGVLLERIFFGNDPASGLERLNYMTASKQMFLDQPFGVGLGHFTLHLQDYLATRLSPWLFQPVHNVFFLIANEAGFIALGLFLALLGTLFYRLLKISRTGKKDERIFRSLSLTILIMVVIISVFDHYFFTLYPAQVLLFLYFALVSSDVSNSLLPRRNS